MRRAPWLSYLLCVGLVLGLLSTGPAVASAQESTQATIQAEIQANDGVGDVAALRAALADESVTSITLEAGTYSLDGAPLVIDRPVSIVGASAPPGSNATTIDAGGSSRVIDVTATDGRVTLAGIVITGGKAAPKPPKDADGGGVRIASGADVEILESSVTGNAALDGGGILNNGVLAITASTIDTNTATGKGGGLRDNGRTTITNSTITANTAAQGGGISTPGSTSITHATIVGNVAGNSSTGGVDVNGGSVSLAYSIIANNVRSNSNEASDCSGTPFFAGLNLISVIDGCNPDGEVIPAATFEGPVSAPTDASIVIVGDAMAGSLAPNGGPTKTMALFGGSPALDAISSPCGTDVAGVDQRGVARPGEGPSGACDLGAFERANLDAELALTVDTSAYVDLDPGVVEVGAVSVPVDGILAEIISQDEEAVQAPDATALRSIALRSIALRSIELQDIALRSIPVEDSALRSILIEDAALRSIALRSIALRSIALRSIALRSIVLSEIPLLDETGWDGYIAGTPALADFVGLPLQSITLEDLLTVAGEGVSLPDPDGDGEFTLLDVSLESTALRSIALRSIVLAGTALRSIPIEVADGDATLTGTAAWCFLFDEICGDDEGELTAAELGDLDLLDAQLAGANVDDVPIFDIALTSLADAQPSSAPDSTALRSIALRSIALRSIDIQGTALRSIALRSIALRSIDTNYIGQLIDCAAAPDYCSDDPVTNTYSLGDAAENGYLRPTVDNSEVGSVGALLDSLADIALACADASSAEAAAIGEESCEFIEGLTFGDLLLGFIAPDEPAWESLDLDSALLQNIASPLQPAFDYIATITIVDGPADLDVTLTLPQGFAAARAAGETATFNGESVEADTGDLDNLRFVIPGVGSGTYQLRIPARAGLVTGTGTCEGDGAGFGCAIATLDASRGEQGPGLLTDSVAVSVVEAAANEPASTTLDSIPTLQLDGQLELAHIASSDDVDVFRFTVDESRVGAQARILLSNIPADVDYDLAVYATREASLRGTPSQALGLLPDKGYDLSPSNDVESTDTVEDIQLDVPADVLGLDGYAVRDTSTRRSNEDEEVSTGALRAGDYYVAVTSFNGALSNQPYGLRLKLDGAPQLPDCAPARFADPAGSPLLQNTVVDGTNTVYLTNTRWLEQQLAGGDVTVAQIGEAITATDGINGVAAGILPLDATPAVVDAYDAWNDDDARCDPDARNEVVRQIGLVLDGLPSSVENLVIVGGDGVVPMAAVPDLTAFSNETTFAADVAFGAQSNEISGALAAGYLLTDDPYATEAGISILNGDHELYLPQLTLGRLVETGPEIVGQLDRFVEFNGMLDPGTTPGALTSAVTGYDFLDDGADAVAGELGTADEDRLTGEGNSWTDEDFLALLGSKKYNVLSPNAHYDYESLLPGAFDGKAFSNDDLVTSTEVDAASLVPTGALIFTMGCHAGLPVDDVQIGYSGLSVPDWAQTFSQGANSYAAHTTYGYGDTEIVAYSEKLTQIFARSIASLASGDTGAPASVGEALRDAKAEYLATTLVLTPYDEKILQSLTHYGLPMYDIGVGATDAAAVPDKAATALQAEALSSSTPVDFGQPSGPGAPLPIDIDLTLDPSLGSSPTNLHRVSTASGGEYFEVGGNVVASQFRPVQPLVQVDVPGPAGGFLITSLDSVELDVPDDFVPYYGRPILDSSSNEGVVVPGDGSFPASLQRIAPGNGSAPDRLLVAAGQLEDRVTGGSVQRLFTHIGGELYPLDAPDGSIAEAPQIYLVDGRVDDQQPVVRFEITTESNVQRVFILYREIRGGGTPEWRGLDLADAGTTDGRSTWLGAAPVNATGMGDNGAIVEFFAQAVGDNGRVGIADNKVYNYLTTLPDEFGDFDLDLTCGEGCEETNGYFPGAVTAAPAGGDGFVANPAGYLFTVDNVKQYVVNADGTFSGRTDDIAVTGDGGHVVLAVDPDTGARAYAFFVIDASPPALSAEQSALVDPDTGFITGTRVTLTATDLLSGVGSITYTVDPPVPDGDIDPACTITAAGGEGTAQTVTCDDVAETYVDIRTPGSSTIEAWVTDKAGNETGSATDPAVIETVAVDGTAPTITATADPASAVTSYVEGPVTVTFTADDADGSGVAAIVVNGETTTVDPASPTVTRQVTQDGETTFTYSAIDAAGNSSADATITVKVDGNAPTITAAAVPADAVTSYVEGPVTVTFTADDADGSGVAAIVVNGETTTVDPASPTVTRQVTQDGETTFTYSAIDAAGNSSADATITVKVDNAAPTASVSVVGGTRLEAGEPPNFQLGQAATAEYACSDATLVSCQVSIDGGAAQTLSSPSGTVSLPVTSPGLHTVRVTATDAAGKETSASDTYTVGYRICEDYNYKQAKNVGSNYTIKIRLCDASGNTVNGSIVLRATSVDGDKDPGPNSNGNANPDYFFRGDTSGFIYNLDTSIIAGIDRGLHRLIFDVIRTRPDGSEVVSTGFARFTLR